MKPLRLRGLVTATFTPMHDDGEVNLAAIPAMVDFLISQKINGLYVLGSTGEGVSLTFDERCQVAEAFVQAANKRIPVLIQVGSESMKMSQALAAQAQKIGADAISAVSPVYFKPDTAQVLVETMQVLASGAPKLPFYYYHIPTVTGVTVPILDFLALAGQQIPNFCGIKFTATQLHEFQACVEYADGKYEILWGFDEMLLAGLAMGAQAGIGSTYNFGAPIYHQVIEAFQKGDLEAARLHQSRSQAFIRVIAKYGIRAAQKPVMGMLGVDAGPTRIPVKATTPQNIALLKADLEELGFFDWVRTT
jgi:N-acetylneuraminate lyase